MMGFPPSYRELEQENERLKEVIERQNAQAAKMKNCENCKHQYDYGKINYCLGCNDKSKWELAE